MLNFICKERFQIQKELEWVKMEGVKKPYFVLLF